MRIVIPPTVFKEVVNEGIRRGYPDAQKIGASVEKKKIVIEQVNQKKEFPIPLGIGEREVIELAMERKTKIIVDDKKAMQVCKTFGLQYVTVLTILVELLRNRIITQSEATQSLTTLSREGRYSGEILLRFHEKIQLVK